MDDSTRKILSSQTAFLNDHLGFDDIYRFPDELIFLELREISIWKCMLHSFMQVMCLYNKTMLDHAAKVKE